MRDFDDLSPFEREPFVALSSAAIDHRGGGYSDLVMTLVGDSYSLEVLFQRLEQSMRGAGVDVRATIDHRLDGYSDLAMTLVGDPYSLEVLFRRLKQVMREAGVNVRAADRPRLEEREAVELNV